MRHKVGDSAPKQAPSQPVQESSAVGNFDDLVQIVDQAYNEGVTMEAAERYAARFLSAQLHVAEELAQMDLDARMKKNGLKAIKSSVYMAAATATEKKPSEGFLENTVNLDPLVSNAQERFDTSDSRKESLSLYLGIFKDAHIYFRGIAKGRFE